MTLIYSCRTSLQFCCKNAWQFLELATGWLWGENTVVKLVFLLIKNVFLSVLIINFNLTTNKSVLKHCDFAIFFCFGAVHYCLLLLWKLPLKKLIFWLLKSVSFMILSQHIIINILLWKLFTARFYRSNNNLLISTLKTTIHTLFVFGLTALNYHTFQLSKLSF